MINVGTGRKDAGYEFSNLWSLHSKKPFQTKIESCYLGGSWCKRKEKRVLQLQFSWWTVMKTTYKCTVLNSNTQKFLLVSYLFDGIILTCSHSHISLLAVSPNPNIIRCLQKECWSHILVPIWLGAASQSKRNRWYVAMKGIDILKDMTRHEWLVSQFE